MIPELNHIYQGDALQVLKSWPDACVDAVVTDPVWPNAKVLMHGSNDPYEALRRVAAEFPRILRPGGVVVIQLGCDSDPRILSSVPAALPFVRVSWLRYARPHYKGVILYSGDVAYVFGHARLSNGRRILPGETTLTDLRLRSNKIAGGGGNGHPCPRGLAHVKFLVASYTKEDDLVLDPFAGSGTTLVACQELGRRWVGIEIEPEYVQLAERRIEHELAQLKLLLPADGLTQKSKQKFADAERYRAGQGGGNSGVR